jgi:uncharacterized membrane protein (UPF0127 family)
MNVSIFLKSLLINLLLIFGSCCYANIPPQLTIEIATTPAQHAWGLMGRQSLADNHGMLFVYEHPQIMNFWMFNTYIDLSIAFIDEKKIVREIQTMKAYPEKMDPRRPIKQLSDIDKYSNWGPTKLFFMAHQVSSSVECLYALEVNAGWFERHKIKVGDSMIFDEKAVTIRFNRPS